MDAAELKGKFRKYQGGMYEPLHSTVGVGKETLSHAMVLTGYGTSSKGCDYWILKNSWGTKWGNKGYLYLLKDTDNPNGTFGMYKQACYPTLN
ncbi:hypothetical protein OROGR_029227 [Orobanche gracilis]